MTAATLLRRPPDGPLDRVATRGERPPLDPGDADVATDATDRWCCCCAAGRCPRTTCGCSPRSSPTSPWSSTGPSWPPRPPRRTGSSRATGCGPRCWRPSPTTCARPWPGSRRPSPRCAPPTSAGPPSDQDELLAAIEDSADRLGAIIANLLDLSRLQTGGVTLVPDVVGLEDVVSRALVRAGRGRPGAARPARRPAGGARRRRPPRPGGRQPRRQRAAAHRRRRARRQRRSRTTGPGSGSSTTAPASRPPTTGRCSSPFQRLGDAPGRRGRRPRPGGRARPDRGDGRHADRLRHPRRRPDHDGLPARRTQRRRPLHELVQP